MRIREPIRICWLQFGHTFSVALRSSLYSTDSQPGHLTHTPSGTRLLEAVSPPLLRLIRGGRILSIQLIVLSRIFPDYGRALCVTGAQLRVRLVRSPAAPRRLRWHVRHSPARTGLVPAPTAPLLPWFR